MRRIHNFITVSLVLGVTLTGACTKVLSEGQEPQTWEPDRPDDSGSHTVTPYTGTNPTTLDAQARFFTGNDLHTKVIRRSCSGTGGVCHNQKEYPDMRTAESFLAMADAPCNINSKFYGAIFDRCERPGDLFSFNDEIDIEIGSIQLIPGVLADGIEPDATSPGLHITLRSAISNDTGERWAEGVFRRRLIRDGAVEPVVYARHSTTWWVIAPDHIVGVVREYQTEAVAALVGAGILQGDGNRNGVFGADGANLVAMLNPGKPDESYLLGRLMGTLQGTIVPGTRMPLANLPPTMPEMLALACFIEGLPTDGTRPSMSWAIDYANCSYNENPEALALTGSGVTWSNRIRPLLQANCGGCHGGNMPSGNLDLLADTMYDRLLAPSAQVSTLQLVRPGNPSASYLWLKLTDAAAIMGEPMPQDPQVGYRRLTDAELADIETWIISGALED